MPNVPDGTNTDRETDIVTVLLVDDHPAVTGALAGRIQEANQMDVIATAHSEDEAMEHLSDQSPDVAVVDIFLGDSFGLDLVRNIQTMYEEVEVVVYSMYDDKVYAERALQSGARAYLTKREPTEHVLRAIEQAAKQKVYLNTATRKALLEDMANGQEDEESSVNELTDRELAVFQMLGEGCTKEEIADRLKLSPRTVETYRRQARKKLESETPSEFLQMAIRWAFSQ